MEQTVSESDTSQWTIEADIQLINLVKKYNMFYNPKSSNYRNSTLKSDVWKRIGSILDKRDQDCSKRWFYVKRHYVKRRNKPAPKKITAAVQNGLKRAKLLKFLDQYCNIDSYTNDSSSDQSANEGTSSEMSYDNDNETDNDNDIVEVDHKDEIVDLEDENFDNKTETEQHRNEEVKQDSEKANDTENFDETDHFFASMAKITKKLPRRDQIVLRMQISTMIGNAELKQMDGGK